MTPVPVASLDELPPPPPGREGWPWTQQSDPVAPQPPGGGDWPSISLVMPSLNQAEYLEEAIRSVLLQGYPNLEFVIRDGGSSDGSVEIIRKHERWISHWVSQPDGGQSRALNEAFEQTSGEIFQWLCSDDTFAPNTLGIVGREFAADSELDVVLGWGKVEFPRDPARNRIAKPDWDRVRGMPFRNTVPQQSCFFRRSAVARRPLLDENLDYYMDYDLWCHLLYQGRKWRLLSQVLGSFRMYGDNKTCHPTPRRLEELEIVHRRYRRERIPLTMWYRRFMYPVDVWASRNPGRWTLWARQTLRKYFVRMLGPWYGHDLCQRISWPVDAVLNTARATGAANGHRCLHSKPQSDRRCAPSGSSVSLGRTGQGPDPAHPIDRLRAEQMTPIPVASLDELPPPPPGREGWPWTQQSDPVAPQPPGGGDWPSISLVMPSLNQAEYLEEAIRSVLLQRYPNLEFVIRDGGSTDGSVEIIRKYERWISHWSSQPDGGQSAAINAGFDQTSGEVFDWLCSDDILYPGALRTIGAAFASDPLADVVCGSTWIADRLDASASHEFPAIWERIRRMPFRNTCPQQSCFWRREVIRRPALLDETLHYCMDYELWCYLLSQTKRWKTLPDTLAEFRMYGENKTSDAGSAKLDELEEVYRRYRADRIPLTWWYRHWLYPIDVWAGHRPARLRKRIKQVARAVFVLVLGPWYGPGLCRMISWPTYYAPKGRQGKGGGE